MAVKNIVICSDGTGNRGGKGNGTNVWRLYNAVNLRSSEREQITHYDDGVGTDDNKYLRAFGGAVGWGFSNNVKRAYRFLTNTWNEGDRIYMFGFSRGAYTVRALAAFVAECGVIEGIGGKALDDAIDQLVNDYHKKRIDENYDAVPITGPIDIQFVGVWRLVDLPGAYFRGIGYRRHYDLPEAHRAESAVPGCLGNTRRLHLHACRRTSCRLANRRAHVEHARFFAAGFAGNDNRVFAR